MEGSPHRQNAPQVAYPDRIHDLHSPPVYFHLPHGSRIVGWVSGNWLNPWRGRRVGVCGCQGEQVAVMGGKVNLLLGLRVRPNAIEVTFDRWRLFETCAIRKMECGGEMLSQANLKACGLARLLRI